MCRALENTVYVARPTTPAPTRARRPCIIAPDGVARRAAAVRPGRRRRGRHRPRRSPTACWPGAGRPSATARPSASADDAAPARSQRRDGGPAALGHPRHHGAGDGAGRHAQPQLRRARLRHAAAHRRGRRCRRPGGPHALHRQPRHHRAARGRRREHHAPGRARRRPRPDRRHRRRRPGRLQHARGARRSRRRGAGARPELAQLRRHLHVARPGDRALPAARGERLRARPGRPRAARRRGPA